MQYNGDQKPLQTKIQRKIEQIRNKITYLTAQSTYQSLSRTTKKICIQIEYLLTLVFKANNNIFSKCLNNICGMIYVLVQATDYQSMAHRLPLLFYVIRKYRNINKTFLHSNMEEKVAQRFELNQKDEMFAKSALTPISSQEIAFWSSGSIHSFLTAVTKNEIYLQNSTNVCSSTVFIKNQVISHNDPIFSKVVTLGPQKGFDQITLTRYLSALCNGNGGVVLIGATKFGNFVKVGGIRFKNDQQIAEKQKIIVSSVKNVRPYCKYKIDRLHVHTNYLQQQPNIPAQFRRFCYRIQIFPFQQLKNRISYFELYTKGFPYMYQIYQLNNKDELIRLSNSSQDDTYKFILSKYQSKKLLNAFNYQFQKPYKGQSKKFQKFVQMGMMTIQQIQNFKVDKQDLHPKQMNDDPKFKYSNTCLVAAVSKKNQRHILDFFQKLKDNKFLVDLTKPYEHSFKNCSRPIFILSHQISFEQLKKNLTMYEKDSIKPDTVKLIPVTQILQVDNERLSTYIITTVQKRFKQRYNHIFQCQQAEIQDKKMGGAKQVTYFILQDISKSIYVYMIFQQLQIRPFFVKPNSLGIKIQEEI